LAESTNVESLGLLDFLRLDVLFCNPADIIHVTSVLDVLVFGIVGNVIHCVNEVTLHRAKLVLECVTVFGRYTTSLCNQPTRSTQGRSSTSCGDYLL